MSMRYRQALDVVNSETKFLYPKKVTEIENHIKWLEKHSRELVDKESFATADLVNLRKKRWESVLREDMMKRR